jgi:hypothetical protein
MPARGRAQGMIWLSNSRRTRLASRVDIGLRPSGSHALFVGTVEDCPLNAAVAIFETHNVIELSGACLKDDRVLRAVMRCRVPGRIWTASPGSSSNDSSGVSGLPTSKRSRPDCTATVSSFCS